MKALRAQLAMTQDLVASTKAELESQAEEQNDLRETAAAAAGAARHATGRAQVHSRGEIVFIYRKTREIVHTLSLFSLCLYPSPHFCYHCCILFHQKTAEARIAELESSLLELEATSGQASEESEMREGALKAMAQYRLKELEEELAAEKAYRQEYEKEKEAREAKEKDEKEAAQASVHESEAAASSSSAAQNKALEEAQAAASASAEACAAAEARASAAEASLQEANEKMSTMKKGMASVEAHVLKLEASALQANESSARERKAVDALRAAKRLAKNVQKRLKAALTAAGIELPPLPPAKKTPSSTPEHVSQEGDGASSSSSSSEGGEDEAALIQSLVEELGRRHRAKEDLQQELKEAQDLAADTRAKLQASEAESARVAAEVAASSTAAATSTTANTAATAARVSELEARCARALSECAEAKRREVVATRTAVDALRGVEAQHAKEMAGLKEELSQRAKASDGKREGTAAGANGEGDTLIFICKGELREDNLLKCILGRVSRPMQTSFVCRSLLFYFQQATRPS